METRFCPVCSGHKPITPLPEMTANALRLRGLEFLIDTRCVKCIYEALNLVVKTRRELGLCDYCAGEMDGEICVECRTRRSRTT